MKALMGHTEAPVPEGKGRFSEDWIPGLEEAVVERPIDPAWRRDLRRRAWDHLRSVGLPTAKDEGWRFSEPGRIARRSFRIPKTETASIHPETVADFFPQGRKGIVLVDGRYVPGLGPGTEGTGWEIVPWTEAAADEGRPFRRLMEGVFRIGAFAALNDILSSEELCLRIPRGRIAEEPLTVVHMVTGAAEGGVVAPRILIVVDEAAEGTVVETYASSDSVGAALVVPVTQIRLEGRAILRRIRVQREGPSLFEAALTRVLVGRDAVYEDFSLALGAGLSRQDLQVGLAEPGARAVLNGFYGVDGDRLADHHTEVDHRAPVTTSRQLYKGILADAGRAVFNGRILVRSEAQGTNSYQLNKNLMLGDGCRVDTKPQLEIFADDVKCTHGAAIGRLNDEEIFYLRSRGIDHKKARGMLVRAYVDEVAGAVVSPRVRQDLERSIDPFLRGIIGA